MIFATTVLSVLGYFALGLLLAGVVLALATATITQDKQQRERRKQRAAAQERLRQQQAQQQAEFDRLFKEELRRAEETLRKFHQANQQQYTSYQYTYRQTYTPPPRRKGVVTRGDVRAARALLAKYGGYKNAVKQTHPDYGGNARDFDAVIKAKKLVDRFPHVI